MVARVVSDDTLLDEAMDAAKMITAFPRLAARAAREAIYRADEISSAEGLLFEGRTFHALFGTPDQKESMTAFLEKRKAAFKSN